MGVRFGGYGWGTLSDGVEARGMGRGRGLASGSFCRLGAGGTGPRETSSARCTRTRRFRAALLASSPGSDLSEEGLEVVWDDNGCEAELEGWVSSS